MLSEAQRFWETLEGKVKGVVDRLTKNTFRCERYTVTTAPNGTKIGVTLPMGTKEIFLPYSQEVSNATAGTQVLVVWWGSMSNAKVYYYANGYDGPQPFDPLSKVYPVGSIYMSTVNVSPASFLGGDWQPIKDTFLLAAGNTYTAGNTGGAATHTLTNAQLPNITGTIYAGTGNTGASAGGYGPFRSASGAFSFRSGDARQYGYPTNRTAFPDSNRGYAYVDFSIGSGNSHNNMPPYLVVYIWKRIA